MKKKWSSEEQITKAIKENEAGIKVEDLFRKLGIWQCRYLSMEALEKQLQEQLHSASPMEHR